MVTKSLDGIDGVSLLLAGAVHIVDAADKVLWAGCSKEEVQSLLWACLISTLHCCRKDKTLLIELVCSLCNLLLNLTNFVVGGVKCIGFLVKVIHGLSKSCTK